MTAKSDIPKPVMVRLTSKEVKHLDALAAKSAMIRHRYMSFVLERAMQSSWWSKKGSNTPSRAPAKSRPEDDFWGVSCVPRSYYLKLTSSRQPAYVLLRGS